MFYLDRHVSTQCVDYHTCSLHVRALRDGMCAHFLTYEVMSMCNFKHITPCLSHNFLQVYSKQSTTSRLFNLWTLLTMQLLTYKDVSVCTLSHTRTCLFATCHLIFHVLSRLPRFHTNVSSTRRVHAHVHTLQDECLHTFFWLTKICLCVTFSIWHNLFHLTTHIVVETTYHHSNLTYEPSL